MSATRDMIERAVNNPEIGIDKLEKMLDYAKEETAREAAQEYAAAMITAQSKMPKIVAAEWNRQTSSHYAKLGEIVEKITPIYTAENLALSFSEGEPNKENHVRVLCDIMHSSGHTVQRYIDMPIVTTGIKGNQMMTPTHAEATAFTYGRRYLTCHVFNLSVGKDTDGNSPVDAPASITETQASQLHAAIVELGVDMPKFLQWLRARDVPEIAEIPATQYDYVMRMIKKSAEQKTA